MKKESELKARKAASVPSTSRKTQPHSGFAAPLTLRKTADGLKVERHFTRPGVDPFDEVEWEVRNAVTRRERSSSSRGTSRCRSPGRRPRRTWSPPNTSAARSARPSASAASGSSSVAWCGPSAAGAARRDTSTARPTRRRTRPSSSTSSSTRRCPSTPRSGSTSRSSRGPRDRRASSTPSRTRWSRS